MICPYCQKSMKLKTLINKNIVSHIWKCECGVKTGSGHGKEITCNRCEV